MSYELVALGSIARKATFSKTNVYCWVLVYKYTHWISLLNQTQPLHSRLHIFIWKCIFHVAQNEECIYFYNTWECHLQNWPQSNMLSPGQWPDALCSRSLRQHCHGMEPKKNKGENLLKMNDLGRVSTQQLHVVQSDLFSRLNAFIPCERAINMCQCAWVRACVRAYVYAMNRQISINQPFHFVHLNACECGNTHRLAHISFCRRCCWYKLINLYPLWGFT